jgi:hypothetical protein
METTVEFTNNFSDGRTGGPRTGDSTPLRKRKREYLGPQTHNTTGILVSDEEHRCPLPRKLRSAWLIKALNDVGELLTQHSANSSHWATPTLFALLVDGVAITRADTAKAESKINFDFIARLLQMDGCSDVPQSIGQHIASIAYQWPRSVFGFHDCVPPCHRPPQP